MQTKLDKYIVSCNCNNSKDKEHEMPALKHLIKELKHHLEAPPLPQPSLHNKQVILKLFLGYFFYTIFSEILKFTKNLSTRF